MKIPIKEGEKTNLKKEFPCIEHTIEFEYRGFTFRLWVDNDNLDMVDMPDYQPIIIEHLENTDSSQDIPNLARFITKLPEVNAVQIKWKLRDTEQGLVIYTVDFNDNDPHG